MYNVAMVYRGSAHGPGFKRFKYRQTHVRLHSRNCSPAGLKILTVEVVPQNGPPRACPHPRRRPGTAILATLAARAMYQQLLYGERLKFIIHHATHKDCSSNRIHIPYGAFPQTNEGISERNPTTEEKRKQTEQTERGCRGVSTTSITRPF